MGRHWHAVTVRTDGLAAVLGPLLTDPRIRSAALIDVDSGMVLDVCGPDTSAGRFGLGRPAEHDHRDEVRGAAHAELVRIGLALAPGSGGLITLVLEAGPDRHVLHTVADPHGGRLALSVVVRGSDRTVAKVRKRLRAISETALTAGPSVAVRPGSAGWRVPGRAGTAPVDPGSAGPGRPGAAPAPGRTGAASAPARTGAGPAAPGRAGPRPGGPDPAGPGSAGPGSTGPGSAGPGSAGPGSVGPGPAGPGSAGPGPGNSGPVTSGRAGRGSAGPGEPTLGGPPPGPGAPGYTGAPAVALPAPRYAGRPPVHADPASPGTGASTTGARPEPRSEGGPAEVTMPSRPIVPVSPAAAPGPTPDPARAAAASTLPERPDPAARESPEDHAAPAPADR